MDQFLLLAVHRGRVVPLGPQGRPSAIDKQSVAGPVAIGTTGLEGDEQGDQVNHGGPDKAVHAYPIGHNPAWAAELPQATRAFAPGAFGENLSVSGVDETGICLGDRWRLGTAELEVSQSRQPCWKLNHRFGVPDMAQRVQASGRTGWYFRVPVPGLVEAGQQGRLIHRPHPGWTLARVNHLLYHDRLNLDALSELAALPGLPPRWREITRARLETRAVEDWSRRLQGERT
jgi:MOSC domain-containing protein YiiM